MKTGAIYWKDELARVIEEVEGFDQVVIADLISSQAKELSAFTCGEKIVSDYEEVFKG